MDNLENLGLDEISKFIFTSKYARYNEKLKRRETWEESVKRVEEMHLKKYSFLSDEDKKKVNWAFDLVRDKRVAPSMRSLQFGGKAVEAHNARLFNCSVRHVDSLRSFAEIFYLLLCGCGVGIGLSKHFLSRLPDLVNEKDKTGTIITYVVEDDIEGWADSIEALLMCYFHNTPYTGRKIVFDYSRIRPEGSPLKTGGGKAPGYKGLKECHRRVKELLDHIIEYKKQNRLKSINAYDIIMHCGDAVLSGGVRRTACSVIFEIDDDDMINSKTYLKVDKVFNFYYLEDKTIGGRTTKYYEGKVNFEGKRYEIQVAEYELDKINNEKLVSWRHIFPQRARSNNSVLLLRDKHTLQDFKNIIDRTKQFGEPGFVWGNHNWQLFNPCFTIDTKILTDHGWRTFAELINKEPVIIQDSRVKGYVEDGQEKWKFNFNNKTTQKNKATNVRKTGEYQDIYELTSSCGRKVKATKNHLFATMDGKMSELGNLHEGDKILIALPEIFNPDKNSFEHKIGFISGLIYGDGCITNDSAIVDLWEPNDIFVKKIEKIIHEICTPDLINQKTHKKLPEFSSVIKTDLYEKFRLNSTSLFRIINKYNFSKNNLSWLHLHSKNFKSGFLSGLFYSDGHVDYNNSKRSLSLRMTSVNFDALQDLQLICQELGIFSRIKSLLPSRKTLLPDGKGDMKLYPCKPSFRLIISSKNNCQNMSNIISIFETSKIQKLNSIITSLKDNNNNEQVFIKVKSIKYIGKEDVYCLSEDNNRTLIAEGFTAKRCFEIGFLPVTEDGICGVQMCNLTSQNGAKIKTKKDWRECIEAATIIGTLQAGYTNFPYLCKSSEYLTKEEALLGVSITGIMDNPDILLNPEYQSEMAKYAVKVNVEWAKKLGINPAARVTCVKPEGTASLALKSASGIHPRHARRFIRRVQVNYMELPYKHFRSINPHACEKSVWDSNHKDDVISFPIIISDKSMVKNDLTALKHLEYIKSTQQNWVLNGVGPSNHKVVEHNVSCTITVKDNEWDDVVNYIYQNRNFFAAVSMVPYGSDKDYPQAPNEEIVTPEDEKIFNELLTKFKSVNYSNLKEDEDKTQLAKEISCAGGACELV